MITSARGRYAEESGAAAVEFALVLPIFLLLVVGMIEFGLMFNTQLGLSAGAREGARVMAVHSSSSIPAVKAAAMTTARNAVKNAAFPVPLTDANIVFVPSTCAGVAVGATMTVTVQYSQSFMTGFFGGGKSLQGKGVMQCGG